MKKQILAKQQAVEQLTELFKNSKTIVAFEYPGLTVSEITDLRRKLRDNGCQAKIYKNNIARRAAKQAGFKEFSKSLVGPLAIVTSTTDVVNPAKIVYEFSKTNKKVIIRNGIIEGKEVNNDAIVELASIPSRDTLLTMLAAGLLAPVRDLTIGLNMLVEKQENKTN